jgi:hypothetical protein
MAKSYNTEPYYDDFDETKNYHRILFRPGYAVQARELTQLQTALQNQITKFGEHVFKEGAMVIPGEASIDTKIDYVKLESVYGGILTDNIIENFLGTTIQSTSNGLQAEVVWYVKSTGSDPAALYVRYKTSAEDNTTKVFGGSDILEDVDGTYNVQVAASNATGKGSLASIKQGIYFIKGCFVYVPSETIVLDKFSNTPSYRIGLRVSETETTAQEDESLFDNAQNSFNYAAPGAHRYTITTNFVAIGIDSTDDAEFIELIRTGNGQVKKAINQTEYSVLAREFARRTYDESGNYTVRNFEIDIREFRDNNRGDWVSGRVYLAGDVVTNGGNYYVARNSSTSSSSVPPTHTAGAVYDGPGNTGIQWEYTTTPYFNRGVNKPADNADLATNQAMESKLAVGMEPGKAYVQGYEIEKVSTEYVAVEKARTSVQVNAETIPATVGNYVKVTNLYGPPPLISSNRFAAVTLYNRHVDTNGATPAGGTVVGTARVRFLELDNGTYGTATAVYKLGLFDVQMGNGYDFNDDVKSFYYNNASGADFTADISPELTQLTGSVSASTTTLTGNGTSFLTQLSVGDYISVTNTSGVVETRRIDAKTTQTTATINAAFSGTVTNSAFSLVRTKVYETENSPLVFPLKKNAIKSVTAADGTNDTIYSVYETFSGSVSSGQISISTSSGTLANGADTDQYLVIDLTSGASVAWTSISATGSGATINVSTALNGRSVVVIAQVNKSGSTLTRKSKTLVSAATATFTTQATAQAKTLLLGKADGYRLISVKMKSGNFSSPGATYSIDITDRYDFDGGQRDSFYDQTRLVLKSSYAPPEAPIQVTFDYFTHSTGDYFTVDSYPANVEYKAIPYWNGVPLTDYIDFRPRIDDTGANFTGTGSSFTLIPKRGVDPVADYSYYLGRKAKIAVDFAGNFFAIDGVPSVNPGEPLDPSLGLVLYGLTLQPFTPTTTSGSVSVQKYDNKRYTMRDIGKLEKRIDNLEYYTSLSLLEQQTETLNIVDSNGLDRFKNGFIVDNFTSQGVGNTSSGDYLCSIDMENGELRPFFAMHNVNLLEKATSNTERSAANYQTYGDVITLPVLDHIPLIKQDFASRLENINPFAVFTFLGDVKLNPSSDDWFEVDRRPDLVIDVEGNYNAVKNIAERAGVLGTVWNAWQTSWTGTPISRGSVKYTFGSAWASGQGDVRLSQAEVQQKFGITSWGNARQITVETTATQVGQTRTGIKTSLVSRIDRQVVGDRVLSTAAIPYMRSRNVLVQIKKLKPNTKFYPFFDGVDISTYCTPASKIEYTPGGGTFDVDTNVGGLASGVSRRINGDSQMCLNRGDVVTGGTSGATAVVVGKEYNPDTNKYYLSVVNIIGTFSNNETITGSVSAATGSVVAVTTKAKGSDLITNFSGEIQLLFAIPNNDSLRFRSGTRELKLVDVNTADGIFTSRARANYRAEGILETRQQTVHAVRNAELVEEQLVDNRVIVNTAERIVSDTGWWDPLAQTFLIEQKGGCFLSKIDVFFATKDDKIPVTLEIRECVNGYPGKRVLPFSRVTLNPEQVNLSSNVVPLEDGTTANKYDVATSFVFPSPVYVQENTEYAVVLASDSNGYRVWVSQVGDTMPGTSRTISEQPYLGSLFKSQNASTWTADQTQDLKFTIYRAQFDTTVVGNVEYVNDIVPLQTLDIDPFETRAGVNKIRVWQKDHGFPPVSAGGTFVTISTTYDNGTGTITASATSTTVTGSGTAFTTQLAAGYCLYDANGNFLGKVASIASNTSLTLAANATGAVTAGSSFKYKAPVNGIPANEIYTTHTVQADGLDIDSYIINTTTNASASGYSGGSTVRATRHYQYDAVQPSVTMQTFSETPIEFGMKTISGKSVHSLTQSAYTQDSLFTGVLANETNYFGSPRMVASQYNEDQNIGSDKSLAFNVLMSSTNDALSPIIDTHRTSMIVINNKVNSPTELNTNVANLDYNTILSAATGVTISGNTITTSTQNAAFKLAKVGKYLTISGASSGSSTRLITAVAADGSSITFDSAPSAISGNATLVQRERFVEENTPDGSGTMSKYVTKRINFADVNTYVRVNFSANLPAESEIEVWYRTNPVGYTGDFEALPYVQIASPDSTITTAQNETNQFFDAAFSATAAAFDGIQVKLVMKSINSSQVPRIKDLRVVCCA